MSFFLICFLVSSGESSTTLVFSQSHISGASQELTAYVTYEPQGESLARNYATLINQVFTLKTRTEKKRRKKENKKKRNEKKRTKRKEK